MVFEVLNGTLVLFRGGAGGKCTEIPALACFGIRFA
jgi:hypothetical protein